MGNRNRDLPAFLAQRLIQLRHSVPHCMYIHILYYANYSSGMTADTVLCIDRR